MYHITEDGKRVNYAMKSNSMIWAQIYAPAHILTKEARNPEVREIFDVQDKDRKSKYSHKIGILK